jgi:hypothetical protein
MRSANGAESVVRVGQLLAWRSHYLTRRGSLQTAAGMSDAKTGKGRTVSRFTISSPRFEQLQSLHLCAQTK